MVGMISEALLIHCLQWTRGQEAEAPSLWYVERSESLPPALARSALQFTCIRNFP